MKRILFLIISIISLLPVYAKPNPNLAPVLDSKNVSAMMSPGAAATPEVVKTRLESLSTDVEMRYSNDVQKQIDIYIKSDYGRRHLSNLLGKAAYYMPIFERELRKAGLPEELKYIPLIESALDAKATSSQGAAGLWQFMPIAARGYDMKITGAVDDRRDPYLSTERACRMFKDLYEKFGDWSLVVAAYNCGPGTLQRALRKAGGDKTKHNFWTISQYLPSQTRKYLPKFIAMTYVMNFYGAHDIQSAEKSQILATDTVLMYGQRSLREIARLTDVSLSDLKSLNPHFRGDVVPGSSSRPCNLILPVESAREYRKLLGRNTETVPTEVDADAAEQLAAMAEPEKEEVDEAYERVPSSIFPNTYILKKRPEYAARDRRKKRDSENRRPGFSISESAFEPLVE